MNCIKLLFVTLVLSLLNGCTNSLVAVKPDDSTGRFQTPTELSLEENTIFIPIENLQEQQFNALLATINVRWAWTKEYRPYIEEMLTNCGLENFVDKAHLENFVIENNLGDKVPSLNSRIGYNQLSKYVGHYLIIATDLANVGGEWWIFSITVYDPVSSRKIFHASRRGLNLIGMEKPILLPVFNSLKKWVDESRSIQQNPIVDEIGA